MEYVFASAGGRAWIEAMSWIVAFFVAFFVLGAFVSVPLFALFYLRFSGKTSWLSAGIYAVVSGPADLPDVPRARVHPAADRRLPVHAVLIGLREHR